MRAQAMLFRFLCARDGSGTVCAPDAHDKNRMRLNWFWQMGLGLLLFLAAPGMLHAQDEALLERVDSSYDAGDYAQVILDCDAAIAAFPDSAYLYAYRGIARAYFGEFDTAIVDLDKSIDLEGRFAVPYLERARAYYGLGDREHAHRDIRQCLKRDPDMLEAYLLRAEMYLDEYVLGEAWADIETARRLASRDPEVYCLRAEYHLLDGNPRQAIKEAGTAIKFAPDAAMGYVTRAMAYEAAGDYENAKSDIDFAIQLEPLDYSLLNTRAMILDAMGKREDALEDLARYISKDSLAWDAYLTRAWFSMQDSAWADAEKDLLQAQGLVPDEPSIDDQLGYLYLLMGEPARAQRVLDTLVVRSPSLAFAHANLGYARFLLGDADAGLREVEQAIKLDEYEPRAYYYRAAIYHHLKKPAKACEDLQTAESYGFADLYGDVELEKLREEACK